MQRIGHEAGRLLAPRRSSPPAPFSRARWPRRLAWAALGALVAVVPALRMWGFTVDDALISVRYARHLAAGVGWRFDAAGPTSDGVTPLPWPVVLAPLAGAEPLAVLARAKALGLLASAAAGAALGAAIGRVGAAPWWGRAAALAILALSVPVAAHAVSGMETALATALATAAVLLVRRPRWCAIVAGTTAAFRPEMAAWAVTLAVCAGVAARVRPARAAAGVALALAPFACCALVRLAVWGRPAPLALLAKPGDATFGLTYAAVACVVTLAPALVLAPFALARSREALAIVLAASVHVAAIVVVGGDWMPYARLMVPVVPGLSYAAVLAAARAHPLATAARSLAAACLGVALLGQGAVADGRRVGADRRALVMAARPALAPARCVAALDVGWVGAATEADIVDLAGVTDLEIASLPGGHTSKRVDAILLRARHVDALLLYAPDGLPGGDVARWLEASYPRVVEARLARDPVVARHFSATDWLPLGRRGGYVLLRVRSP